MNTKQLAIRITDELDQQIEQASSRKGLTKASWIRQLIIETLAGEKNVAEK